MLNAETKRHIDAARDVLVGVAPNPMTQIDQITYALIYKFMDDMDQAAIKAGGEPSFFTGELEPYAWSKLVDSRMGNQEKMNLYGEALQKFAEAKQLPELFRTIFRAAFLPYRSPETLGLFLKEINFFDYTHPEELGNAYEYLLSIMSAQGDAGQFRTPRHIIDFIVDVINPTKDDTVLDPACGTGGFLVASYNHILEQHDGKNDSSKQEKPLTPDERKKLMNNFEGYDIDPSMVRIAQVNMYLHQFKNPKIVQYDSLTSEERWNDKFDVILANPPFMSPKGGIKPHNKFALQSNRSEVLFVDYIANHLKPNGRAGIIVPEGIIFQSGKAYKQLRKELVEGGLYAVVSLPSGVFNPYSGVKTSILLINNEIAKQRDEILFVKISADGYDLGANKREITDNDLPEALRALNNWRDCTFVESGICISVSRQEVSENDFNLSADRYRISENVFAGSYPLISIQSLENEDSLELLRGANLSKSDLNSAGKNFCIHYGELYTRYGVRIDSIHSKTDAEGRVLSVAGDVLVPATTTADALGISIGRSLDIDNVIIGGDINVIRTRNRNILGRFLAYLISYPPLKLQLAQYAKGTNIIHLSNADLRLLEFPLPPLEVQEQIVAELDGYAAIMDGAKKIVENWKPKIDVDPAWLNFELEQLCTFENGDRSSNYPSVRTAENTGIPFINAGNIQKGDISLDNAEYISEAQFEKIGAGKLEIGDIVFCLRGSLGKVALNKWLTKGAIASSLVILRPKREIVDGRLLFLLLASTHGQSQISRYETGAAQPNLSASNLKKFQFKIPALLHDQLEIVDTISQEESVISSMNKLIQDYEIRISKVISNLWNE